MLGGQLSVAVPIEGDPYGRVKSSSCWIVVDYASEPEGLSAEELAVWNSVRTSLSANMLQFAENTNDLHTSFSERKTDDPHGGGKDLGRVSEGK